MKPKKPTPSSLGLTKTTCRNHKSHRCFWQLVNYGDDAWYSNGHIADRNRPRYPKVDQFIHASESRVRRPDLFKATENYAYDVKLEVVEEDKLLGDSFEVRVQPHYLAYFLSTYDCTFHGSSAITPIQVRSTGAAGTVLGYIMPVRP